MSPKKASSQMISARFKKQMCAVNKKPPGKQARLKPAIWRNTPHDIIDQLFRFLPLTSLCRFKGVSRSWCSRISSTTPSSGDSFFIAFMGHNTRIFNGDSWINFPMTIRVSGGGRPSAVLEYLSCAGGLVLASGNMKFIVQNPLVPACAALLTPLSFMPSFVDADPCLDPVAFAGIQVLPPSTSGGKISFVVVCVTSGNEVLVHVFDSRRWSWVVESAPVMPGELGNGKSEALVRGIKMRTTLVREDELLYFVTVSKSNDTRSLKSINIWDPTHSCKTLATWKDLPLGLHQSSYHEARYSNNPSLVSCQGKLMMVNVISYPPNAIGFVVLDEESRSWREVASIPMDGFPAKTKEKPFVTAVGRSRESSQVALHFPYVGWGCSYDLATSTLSSIDNEIVLEPYHPSFLQF